MPNVVVNINLNDMSEEVRSALKQQIVLSLQAIGMEAEGYAKDECPVDTGTLRNSISFEVIDDEQAVYVGTNVEYGVYVEYGDKAHHEVGRAHFLRDSAVNHADRYKSIMEAFLSS